MDVLKIIAPTVMTFSIGIFITPFFTKYFYKYKMWKKSPRVEADTSEAPPGAGRLVQCIY